MITMGCDVGSLYTKAVIMRDDDVAASRIIPTTGNIGRLIDGLLVQVCADAGIERRQIECLGATGQGADLVSSADFIEDAVNCVAAAAAFFVPEAKAAIDIGGQSITAMTITPDGEITNFIRNDKCASGSGRFLEILADKLQIGIDDIDKTVAQAQKQLKISNQCGVFVESEVITYLNAGEATADIMAGICLSLVNIVSAQSRKLREIDCFTVTGGVGHFRNITDALAQKLGSRCQVFPVNTQLAAALGAALLEEDD